jgi:parvulin-like peptidyl-prolyl isomerase
MNAARQQPEPRRRIAFRGSAAAGQRPPASDPALRASWGALGLALVLLGLAPALRAIPVDGYAASVNDQVITVADVMAAMQPVERQLRQTLQGEELTRQLEEAYHSALESLIERALILDAFSQRKDLALPDTYVNARVEEIIRNKFNNSLAEFNKALQAEGLTLGEWKKNLRASIIVSLMREQEVERKVSVSPQAVLDAYLKAGDAYRIPDQVELRMIVLHRGTNAVENALKRKQAEDICRRLLAGEDFAELARQVSEGPKAAEGGYVGWIDPTTRRSELADAIADMDAGEISDVIPTDENFYILKTEGRKNGTVIPFEKVQETIRETLQKQETQRLFEAWIARLKKNAFIKKH